MKGETFQDVTFANHDAAVAFLVATMDRDFEVYKEVSLESAVQAGKKLRVDAIAVHRSEPRYIIGLEVKSGFYRMSEYAHSIKQASDYRQAYVTDSRLPELEGGILCATFIFPRWHGTHDAPREYRREAEGMEILAHHFRVGMAGMRTDGSGVELILNRQSLWKASGWSGNARGILEGATRLGSGKGVETARISKL